MVPDHLRKGERRILPTTPFPAGLVGTSLLTLRGVNSVEPNTLPGYLDGVAVDNSGFAGDTGPPKP